MRSGPAPTLTFVLRLLARQIVVGGVNMLEKVDELKQRSEDIKREAVG